MSDPPKATTPPVAFSDLSLDQQLAELADNETNGTPYRGNLFQLRRIQQELETNGHPIPGHSTAESLALIDKMIAESAPITGTYQSPEPYRKPKRHLWRNISIGLFIMGLAAQLIGLAANAHN